MVSPFRIIALALAALALGACKGDSTGPVDLQYEIGIISGNHQVARAGDSKLSDPVIGKLVAVRLADGSTRFRLVTPLYAQTVVQGSPVPGAVVCAEDPNDDDLVPLIPEVRCTNTDANGQATFWFRPGTRAGQAASLIKGTVEGKVEVFDSVMALIQPGPIAEYLHGAKITTYSPAYLDDILWPRDHYKNPIYGTVDVSDHPTVQLAGTTGKDARTLVASGTGCGPIRFIIDGEVVTVARVETYASGDNSVLVTVTTYHPDHYVDCST